MPRCMARHVKHPAFKLTDQNLIALGNRFVHVRDARLFRRRAEQFGAVFLHQFRIAANMVVVMVGINHQIKLPVAVLKFLDHRGCFARINDRGHFAAVAAHKIGVIV